MAETLYNLIEMSKKVKGGYGNGDCAAMESLERIG
jgi:hypothetical protein